MSAFGQAGPRSLCYTPGVRGLAVGGRLEIVRAHRLDNLLGALAERVAVPPAGAVRAAGPLGAALVPEAIVVPSAGMERWVAMGLAARHGVWANPVFCFPRKAVEEAFAAVPAPLDGRRWSREALVWSVDTALATLPPGAAWDPLRRALAGPQSPGRQRAGLAGAIANLFDQYAVFRPDLVADWEAGGHRGADAPGDAWQPVLWRQLLGALGRGHFAHRAADFAAAAAAGQLDVASLRPRWSVFGISALPPAFLQVFSALSAVVDVHLYLPQPTPHWFGDQRRHDVDAQPLLASLGRVAREFQGLVVDLPATHEDDRFDPAPAEDADCLLHQVQSDVHHLVRRGPGGLPGRAWPAGDDSVEVHAFSGPWRAVEALRDRLLRWFDADDSLRPEDIVVLVPDVEAWGPVFDAVWSGAEARALALPFHVADRSALRADGVLDGLLALLGLVAGRLGAPALRDFLGRPLVAARFGLDATDLNAVEAWFGALGLSWGEGPEDRAARGLPAEAHGTLRPAVDRLLLGWALPAGEDGLWAGVSPMGGVEGSRGALVGRLAAAVDAVLRFRRAAAQPLPPADWAAVLGGAVDTFFLPNADNAWMFREARVTLTALAADAAVVGHTAPVEATVWRDRLAARVGEGASHAFLSRGITVCNLLPMRSIPFRVVCVLGLDDGAFPRAPRPPGFDLIARHPRPGDRSVREDDRQLFLDAVLSAGDRLWVGYTGVDAATGGHLPPSPVLAELLDVLKHTAAQAVSAHPHPRAPFHPSLFAADAPFPSHDAAAAAGAQAHTGAPVPPPPFFGAPLPDDPPEQILLDDLVHFFEDPARVLLQARLQMRFPEDDAPLAELPPDTLGGLETWAVAERWLGRARRGGDSAATAAALRSENRLTPGTLGTLDNRAAQARGEGVWARAAAELGASPLAEPPRVSLGVQVGGRQLVLRGWLAGARPSGLVVATTSRLQGKRLVRAAVQHLALQVAAGAQGRASVLVGRAAVGPGLTRLELPPLPPGEAAAQLEALVNLRAEGLRAPLPFWPDAAFTVARAANDAAAGDALRTAWSRAVEQGGLPRPLTLLWSQERLATAPGLLSIAQAVMGPLRGAT